MIEKYQSKNVSADYLEDIGSVLIEWKTFGFRDEVVTVMSNGLELMKAHGGSRWMADLRLMEGGFDDSNDWIANTFMPAALAAGLTKMATIISDDAFLMMSAQESFEKISGSVGGSTQNTEEAALELNMGPCVMRYYFDIDKAKEWLRA